MKKRFILVMLLLPSLFISALGRQQTPPPSGASSLNDKQGEASKDKDKVAGGSLLLGADLQPGEYILQVIVIDKLAKEDHRMATQWIDFEIVKCNEGFKSEVAGWVSEANEAGLLLES